MNEPDQAGDERIAELLDQTRIRPSGPEEGPPPADLTPDMLRLLETAHQLDAAVGDWLSAGEGPPAARPAPQEDRFDFLAPPQSGDELGRLGPYRVLRILGRGGMGVVFLAEDPQLKRRVALKAMQPALTSHADSRRRFLREAQATAALKSDHIVTIHQVGEDREVIFLAMELLEGEPLDRRLTRGEQLPVAEILRLGKEIGQGLATAHQRGLIHRDVKPGNIWLEAPTGRVKILDFGLAHVSEDSSPLTSPGAVLGTPAYMAPEQAQGGQASPRSDLFSLGCVLYHLCTGRRPFAGPNTMAVLSALALVNPRPVRELNPEIPAALSDLVMRLLEKDPAKRPGSAQEVVHALETIQVSGQAPTEAAGPSTAVVPQSQPVRPRRRRWGVAAAALLLLGALGWHFGPTLFRVATDQGDLIVKVDDAEVEVTVKQHGVVVRPRSTGREFLVKAGKGTLEVYRPGESEALLVKEFELSRAGRTIVMISHDETTKKGPAATPPGDPYRRLAEWVLRRGGSLFPLEGGSYQALDQLPKQPFKFVTISITLNQPAEEDTLLSLMGDLPEALARLYLSGALKGDQTLEKLAARPATRGLQALTLFGVPVTDAGLRHLSRFPNLRGLSLNDTQVTDAGLQYIRDNLALIEFGLGVQHPRVTAAGLDYLHPRLTNLLLLGPWLTDPLLDAVVKLPKLDFLDVSESRITANGVLRLAQRFPDLRVLGLRNVPAGDQMMPALMGAQNLEELELSGSPVTDAGLKSLHGLSKLRKLDLTNTKVTAVGVQALQTALPGCRIQFSPGTDPYRRLADWVLRHKGSSIGIANGPSVRSADQLPQGPFKVVTIYLMLEPGKTVDEEALLALFEDLPESLLILDFYRAPIRDQTLEKLAALPGTRGIGTLKLTQVPVSDAGLRHLRQFVKLDALALSNTQVTDAGLQFIRDNLKLSSLALYQGSKVTTAGLAHLDPRLRDVRLSGAWVTDAALEHVMKLPHLERFSLLKTQVTDTGVQRLLPHCPNLLRLELSDSRISDQTLPALAACPRLKSLFLDGTPITDEGLKSLHGLSKLESLDLSRTRVSPAGVRALQAALPKCQIKTDVPAKEPSDSE